MDGDLGSHGMRTAAACTRGPDHRPLRCPAHRQSPGGSADGLAAGMIRRDERPAMGHHDTRTGVEHHRLRTARRARHLTDVQRPTRLALRPGLFRPEPRTARPTGVGIAAAQSVCQHPRPPRRVSRDARRCAKQRGPHRRAPGSRPVPNDSRDLHRCKYDQIDGSTLNLTK
jgi:hypothetical protein